MFICPSSSCEERFDTSSDYRAHWGSVHRTRQGQRVPRAVVVVEDSGDEDDDGDKASDSGKSAAAAPPASLPSDDGEDEGGHSPAPVHGRQEAVAAAPGASVEALVPLVAKELAITHDEALSLYMKKLRRPLLPLGKVFHMKLPSHKELQPLVLAADLDSVMAAVRGALLPPPEAGAAKERDPAAADGKQQPQQTKRPRSAPAAESELPTVKAKRARLAEAELDGKIAQERFAAVMRALADYKETVSAIGACDTLDASAREALLAQCQRSLLEAQGAAGGGLSSSSSSSSSSSAGHSSAGKRVAADPADGEDKPLIVSHMIREHLGYFPANGAGDLCKAIGRAARLETLRRTGAPPPKRSYLDENGEERETNSYSRKEAHWLRGIVADECERLKLYPRPSVALARGEPVRLGAPRV